ncbi:MAG: zinc-binding domain-containing protein [Mesorhizobium sp.]|nr:MAG: zinc-binding domain-containing protein [Mesorhizobium sp.]
MTVRPSRGATHWSFVHVRKEKQKEGGRIPRVTSKANMLTIWLLIKTLSKDSNRVTGSGFAQTTPRVNDFLWLCAHDRLALLHTRHISQGSCWCQGINESTDHVLITCPKATKFWPPL